MTDIMHKRKRPFGLYVIVTLQFFIAISLAAGLIFLEIVALQQQILNRNAYLFYYLCLDYRRGFGACEHWNAVLETLGLAANHDPGWGQSDPEYLALLSRGAELRGYGDLCRSRFLPQPAGCTRPI